MEDVFKEPQDVLEKDGWNVHGDPANNGWYETAHFSGVWSFEGEPELYYMESFWNNSVELWCEYYTDKNGKTELVPVSYGNYPIGWKENGKAK